MILIILVNIGLWIFIWFGMCNLILVLKICWVILIIFGIIVLFLIRIILLGKLSKWFLFKFCLICFKIWWICFEIICER